LFRVLAWDGVAFETHHALPCEDAIREPLEGLLLEASRQRDELARLRESMPPPAAILVIGVQTLPPLTLEGQIVIDAVAHHRLMQAVLNRWPLDDATTAQTVVALQRRDVLMAVEPSRGAFLVPDARHAVFGRRSDPTPMQGSPVGRTHVNIARI